VNFYQRVSLLISRQINTDSPKCAMGSFGICFSDQPDAAAGGAAPIVGHYLHLVLY
jgi:hypothetical protein